MTAPLLAFAVRRPTPRDALPAGREPDDRRLRAPGGVRLRRAFRPLAALAWLTLAAAPGRALAEGDVPDGAPALDDARTPDELWLEGRLRAPCCWLQTLDVHESPLASELRREVRVRLRAGERPEAIESDFAARFGPRVRAVPEGLDARSAIPLVLGAALALTLAALALALRRWLRASRLAASKARAAAAVVAPDDATYEARLDEELRAASD